MKFVEISQSVREIHSSWNGFLVRVRRRHRSGSEPVDTTKTCPTAEGIQRHLIWGPSYHRHVKLPPRSSVFLFFDFFSARIDVLSGVAKLQDGVPRSSLRTSDKSRTPYERYCHGPYQRTPRFRRNHRSFRRPDFITATTQNVVLGA